MLRRATTRNKPQHNRRSKINLPFRVMETSCVKLIVSQDFSVKFIAPTEKHRLPGTRTLVRFLLLVALALNFLLAFPIHATPPPGYYLVWFDEFNTNSLDRTKWDFW